MEVGINYVGLERTMHGNTASVLECMKRCLEDGLCQIFTYNALTRKCFLKDVAPDPEARANTHFAGVIANCK